MGPVRQELENEAVRGEFLLCFWGKKEGGAKEVQLSHLSLTSLEGKPHSVGWGQEGGAMYAVLP